MNPALIVQIAQAIDILIKALVKDPKLVPALSPIVAGMIPALSQSAGETPEQTEARRTAAEAVFAKYALPPA